MLIMKPNPGSVLAVLGVGAVGLSAIMAAKIAGCTTIISVDIKDNRLSLAQELGCTHLINGNHGDAFARILENHRQGCGFFIRDYRRAGLWQPSTGYESWSHEADVRK
jgi:aryl-alcohol dehydrogenase